MVEGGAGRGGRGVVERDGGGRRGGRLHLNVHLAVLGGGLKIERPFLKSLFSVLS